MALRITAFVSLAVLLLVLPSRAAELTVVVGERAPAAEKYAAAELCRYVAAIYRFQPAIAGDAAIARSGPHILLGSPETNRLVARLAGGLDWKSIRADGFFLKTLRPGTLLVGGRLARGTLFGVYELAERWGVRFSLTEDFLPEHPGPFRLPQLDEKREPAYPVRALRPVNNLPEGSAAWDLTAFQRFIGQMIKLKYNTLTFLIMESGPWLDYQFRGVRRPAGDIFYGWRYPVDEHFVGRELFRGQTEFYSSVLAPARDDEERKRLGIALVRAIQEHARERGVMTALVFGLLEPPTEFKHRFNEWATLPLPDPKNFPNAHFTTTPAEEFGTNPRYAAWMNVLDPAVRELVTLRVRALLDTYPGTDYYYLWISEHRAGVVDYRQIYRMLDARYHFSASFDLDRVLENPGDFAYGKDRYQNQVKGDLLFLYLFDEVVKRGGVQAQAARMGSTVGLAGVMPVLAPLAAKMLPRDHAVFGAWLEYGTHATADRLNQLAPLFAERVPTTLEIGIQDDNTMWFPQVNVESLQRIVRQTAPQSMTGYVTTLWQVRQSDINAAYLASASWQPDLTPSGFYSNYLSKLAGSAAAPDFEHALRVIEQADREVKKSLYGFAFAFEGALAGKLRGVDHRAIERIRPQFLTAEDHLRRARSRATERGKHNVDFWLKRTRFAVQWLDLGTALAALGRLLGEARQPGAPLTAVQKRKALAATDSLVKDAGALIEIIVSDAGSIGDLGQVASMNRHISNYLAGLRADLAGRALKAE